MKSIIQYVVFSIIFLAAPSPYAQETQSLGQLKLEKRQPDTSMNVTSVNLGREEFIITGETDMEAYGHVYGTYRLSYNQDRQGGAVHVEGRGASIEGIFSGEGNGYWDLVDGVITIRYIAVISNGFVNLEIARFNPRTREMTLEVYAIK
mgnify:FL=1